MSGLYFVLWALGGEPLQPHIKDNKSTFLLWVGEKFQGEMIRAKWLHLVLGNIALQVHKQTLLNLMKIWRVVLNLSWWCLSIVLLAAACTLDHERRCLTFGRSSCTHNTNYGNKDGADLATEQMTRRLPATHGELAVSLVIFPHDDNGLTMWCLRRDRRSFHRQASAAERYTVYNLPCCR